MGRQYRCGRAVKNVEPIPLLPAPSRPTGEAADDDDDNDGMAEEGPASGRGRKKAEPAPKKTSKLHAKETWAAFLATLPVDVAHEYQLEMEASQRALDHEVGMQVSLIKWDL